MKSQVEISHYNFENYIDKERFLSYYIQLNLINEIHPTSVLEIGVGKKILEKLLPEHINYTGFDFDIKLHPNVQGNIEFLPFKDKSFDMIACFEVLEHLPFSKIVFILKELKRVSKGKVLISLPYANLKFEFSSYLPIIHNININWLVPKFYKKHKFDGEHYWEVGKKNFSMNTIKRTLEQVFAIKKSFVSKDNTYHVFFILENKDF